MYLEEIAYPAGEKILRANSDANSALTAALAQARVDFPPYAWDEALLRKLLAGVRKAKGDLKSELKESPPSPDIATFVILLGDVPTGGNLAGFRTYLKGLSEWTSEGFEEPLYDALHIESEVLDDLESNLVDWIYDHKAESKAWTHAARSPGEVFEMFLGLVFWGIVYRELLQEGGYLGGSAALWVSHPDSEHGVRIV